MHGHRKQDDLLMDTPSYTWSELAQLAADRRKQVVTCSECTEGTDGGERLVGESPGTGHTDFVFTTTH